MFAGVEVVVVGGAGSLYEGAEGVVGIGVGDGGGCVGELADRAVAVVAVEGERATGIRL